MDMVERQTWQFSESPARGNDWSDAEISITDTGKDVLFAVTDEQAVDSYNATFTCSVKVPYSALPGLKVLIDAALGEGK